MASSCSRKIGPSYAYATCFKKKDFVNSFKLFYNIKEDIKLKKVNISFEKLIIRIFGKNKRIVNGLSHWIHFYSGKPINIYTMDYKIIELLGRCNKGLSPFYIVDDMYFIECEKLVICLVIGNDE